MPIITITRKNLLKSSRNLPINKIQIGNCGNDILQQIKPNTTVVLLLDDTKKMNKKCCSKVLKKPPYPSFNRVMTQDKYNTLQERCQIYKRQQVLRYLHMNRVPANIANEYMDSVDKCGNWKPKI